MKYDLYNLKMYQNAYSGWAQPGPVSELTALHRPLAALRGDKRVGQWMEGKGKGEGRGKRSEVEL